MKTYGKNFHHVSTGKDRHRTTGYHRNLKRAETQYTGGYDEDKRCPVSGKLKYRNKGSAERRLKFEKRVLNYDVTTVHKCKDCGAWHITHMNSRDHGENKTGQYAQVGRPRKPYNRDKEKQQWKNRKNWT